MKYILHLEKTDANENLFEEKKKMLYVSKNETKNMDILDEIEKY